MNDEYKILKDRSYQRGSVVEKDGVHFGYYAAGDNIPSLLLYRKGTEEVIREIPFPGENFNCGFYHMKLRLNPAEYEYNFRDGDRVVVDPYARRTTGRNEFGSMPNGSEHERRAAIYTDSFDWENDTKPNIAYPDAVMYHLHVRGFTKQRASGVRKKGTYAGIIEKIPYLKSLGINQIRLMPAYEFEEMFPVVPQTGHQETQSDAKKRAMDVLSDKEKYHLNYWGYGSGNYFSPKESYSYEKNACIEFKKLVKGAHKAGIELLMEFVFPEDASFDMISDCLTWWIQEYHVDGFCILSRSEVTNELSRFPVFQNVKLIGEWFPESITNANTKKIHKLLAESNDGFMNDARRILKGDEKKLGDFSMRIRRNPKGCAVINYITSHDGFTLADLVSYDRKYNMDNGEQDRDGTDYNFSWNCGVEGPSKKKEIQLLRMKQRKNAYAMMLFSQGVPMLLAGDEFGNSQNGNNNAYCHDNECTWLGWSKTKSANELTGFVKQAIHYRKTHKVLHQPEELRCMDNQSDGYPDLSFHSDRAWYCDFDRNYRHIGCMYSGRYAGEQGFVYVAYNFHWNEEELALPLLPKKMNWYKVMDTSKENSFLMEAKQEKLVNVKSFRIPSRTIMILEGR